MTSVAMGLLLSLVSCLGYRWIDQIDGRQNQIEASASEWHQRNTRTESEVSGLQHSQEDFKGDLRRLNEKIDRILEILREGKR